MNKKYNHKDIEKKWQEKWLESGVFKTDLDDSKEKFYLLDMFPYPSGDGIHMGHTEQAAVTDTFYRYKKMKGFNVLHPQGFDSFGLPAENFAIKTKIHPAETTKKTTETFKKQMENLGLGYDFNGNVTTSDPEFYKYTQRLFGEFFKNDIAYKKTAKANWCESCKTVIATEQMENGNCERCGTEIEQKEIPSWMFRITDFADDLIWNKENEEKFGKMDWPEHTKKNQNAWIGRSEGAEIDFAIREKEYFDINRDGGADSYQDGVEEIERYNVAVVIEHPEKEEFLCVKWKKSDWQGFVTGGVEGGDTESETAIKEVQEETGYQNAEVVKVYDKSSHGKFYHVGKKVNRLAHYKVVHVKLKDLEAKERSQEEKDIADMMWVKKEAVKDFLKREDMKYVWRVFCGEDVLEEGIKVFTTRPDTLFGATYMVLAPEHGLVESLKSQITNWDEVQKYISDTKKKTELERLENKEKTGVKLEGVFAINPASKEEVPVFLSDYVLAGYGTGAIMAVPAHDERDSEFAKKFGIEIKEVVGGKHGVKASSHIGGQSILKKKNTLKNSKNFIEEINGVFSGNGVLVNSGKFTGMDSAEAKEKITEFVGGKMVSTYRLRDWSISRQRYWGTPIPIVYSPQGEPKFVGQENLPWLLPTDVDFIPTGVAPLSKSKELFERTERIFGKGWTPEVDTMDTFVDSSWYFLRYCDPENTEVFANPEMVKKWMPVDLYIGGAEHTYMHLLFARFFTRAMKKIGLIDFDEPFLKLRHQGMVNDIHGKKMSKSKGNVVNPDEMVERFGADATRAYMLFSSPLEDDVMWNEDNIVGVYRFLEKAWRQQEKVSDGQNLEVQKELHKTIKSVTEKIEGLRFNVAISDMMKFVNFCDKQEKINKDDFFDFIKILSPFAPHVCDEISGRILLQKDWPEFDKDLAKQDLVKIGIQVNGKRRAEIEVSLDATEDEVRQKVLEIEDIKKWVDGNEIKKFIYVPGKIISIIL